MNIPLYPRTGGKPIIEWAKPSPTSLIYIFTNEQGYNILERLSEEKRDKTVILHPYKLEPINQLESELYKLFNYYFNNYEPLESAEISYEKGVEVYIPSNGKGSWVDILTYFYKAHGYDLPFLSKDINLNDENEIVENYKKNIIRLKTLYNFGLNSEEYKKIPSYLKNQKYRMYIRYSVISYMTRKEILLDLLNPFSTEPLIDLSYMYVPNISDEVYEYILGLKDILEPSEEEAKKYMDQLEDKAYPKAIEYLKSIGASEKNDGSESKFLWLSLYQYVSNREYVYPLDQIIWKKLNVERIKNSVCSRLCY